MMLEPPQTDSLADDIAKLGPVFEVAFAAAIIVVLLALLAVSIRGVIKGYPGVKVKEPQPG
jgi:hypothetical protein